jgi:hypothetical protein
MKSFILNLRQKQYFSTFFNLLIYFSSGILAPLFFKNIPDRHRAAIYAGGLFMVTALRAVRLSLTRPYIPWAKMFFVFLFFAELSFWAWRMTSGAALATVDVAGVSGNSLHMIMTTLYSVSCGVLIYSEIRWLQGRRG